MSGRLEFLDSLRGIAALMVALHHMPLIVSQQLDVPQALKPLQMYGGTGVMLFFVISSFSLCLTMPKHELTEKPLVSYAISRLSRIAPLYYVLFAYSIVYAAIAWDTWHDPLRIFTSLTFTFNLFPSAAWGVVGASWTIGIEMLFYLMFPMLYVRLGTISSRIVFVLISLVVSKIFIFAFLPYIPDDQIRTEYAALSLITHIPTFGLGMVAFSLFQILRTRKEAMAIGNVLLAAGIWFLAVLVGNPDAVPAVTNHQSPALAYFLILVGLGLSPWRILSNKIAAYYGDKCYSVYLWHPPVIYLMEPTYHRIYSYGLGTSVSFTICLALTIAAVTVVADLSHKYIETNGLAAGRWLKSRLVSSSRATVG